MHLKIDKLKKMIRQFGLLFSLRQCFYRFTKQDEKYIRLVYSYLKKFEQPIIDKYSKVPIDEEIRKREENEKIPIWICWFQGEEHMPELCEMCYKRLKQVIPYNAKINLITLENYKEYVTLPEFIIEKFNKGIISYTQLSDILRWSLLKEWGGMWIDSTVFCKEEITTEFLAEPIFWSVKLGKIHDENCLGQVISDCNWSGFLLKDEANSSLAKYVIEATLAYWEKHDVIIDYFIQNMLIKIAYDHIPSIQASIDKIPMSNLNMYELHPILDQEYTLHQFDKCTNNTTFFKLTWKKEYKKITELGKETFYSHLLKIK